MTDNCVVDIKTQNRQQRGYTLFLLLLVFIASHVDRQIVAILQEPIRIAFDLTDTQLGVLTGFAFALFYATLGMPMAMWADRRNRRNLIAFSISLWSAMTVACAAAGQYWQLLAARIGVAVGEAGSNPPSHSIIADLYEPAERATAMAIFGLGVNFGIMFGFLIGGWVNDWVGWRWAFVIAGAPGLLIALAVRFTMQEPPRGLSDGLTSEIQPPPFFLVVRTMWRDNRIRQLLLSNSLISMAGYAAIAWAPVYFQRIHGFSTSESGTFLALGIGLGGGLGTFLGGALADKLSKISEGWRAWIVSFSILAYLPAGYLCYQSIDPFWAIFWFTGPAALGGVYIGVNFAILQSLAPVEMRAVMASINLFVLNIIGLGLGAFSVGMISDLMSPTTGVDSLRYGLMFTLLLMLWGGIHQTRLGFLLNKS